MRRDRNGSENFLDRNGRFAGLLVAAIVAAASLGIARPALAQTTYTWDPSNAGAGGSDGTGLWDITSDLWYNNTTSTPQTTFASGATDIVNIGAGTNGSLDTLTINVPNITVGTLNFDAGSGGYAIAANGTDTLTIGGTGSTTSDSISMTTGGPVTISAPVILGAANTWTDSSSSLLTIGGTVTNGGFLLTVAGTGNTTIGGVISGAGGLTMSGTGSATLTLNSAETYTGNTIVNSGTLVLGTAGSLKNNAGSLTVASGAILTDNNNAGSPGDNALPYSAATAVWTVAGTIDITGSTVANTMPNAAGGATVTLNGGTLTSSATANTTGYGYYFANGVNVIANGSGNLISAYNVGMGPNGLTVTTTNSTDMLTISSNLGTGAGSQTTGQASGGLAKTGNGTVTLTGNNIYTGGTTISGGTLQIGGSGTLGAGAYSAAIADAGTLTFNSSASQTLSGVISGVGVLNMSGASTLTLSGANTYSGGTIINSGTLTLSGAGTLGAATGPLQVNNPNAGAGTNVVLNLSTTAATTAGSLSGTIAMPTSGANTATINTQSGETFTVNQTAAGTFAGVIAGGGNFALGSLSTNTLTLSGTNTYSGATTINAGTLQLDATTPTSTVIPGNAVTLAGGSLGLQGNLSSAGTVTQTVSSLTLATDTGSAITLADAGSATATSLTATAFTQSTNSTLYLNLANAGGRALTLGSAAPQAFVPWAIVTDSTGSGFGSINGSRTIRPFTTWSGRVRFPNCLSTGPCWSGRPRARISCANRWKSTAV